jgi:hypothetical protein
MTEQETDTAAELMELRETIAQLEAEKGEAVRQRDFAEGAVKTNYQLLQKAKAELAEAREDKARLDWLETEACGIGLIHDDIGLIHDDFESWAVATDGM